MTDYVAQRNRLLSEKMKLDKFFTMYLDKFERKMDPENPNTPIWKLFKEKSNHYNKICQEIRNAEYWIRKAV
jgi:hypothetical protein